MVVLKTMNENRRPRNCRVPAVLIPEFNDIVVDPRRKEAWQIMSNQRPELNSNVERSRSGIPHARFIKNIVRCHIGGIETRADANVFTVRFDRVYIPSAHHV